jgi:hypothetical protein
MCFLIVRFAFLILFMIHSYAGIISRSVLFLIASMRIRLLLEWYETMMYWLPDQDRWGKRPVWSVNMVSLGSITRK